MLLPLTPPNVVRASPTQRGCRAMPRRRQAGSTKRAPTGRRGCTPNCAWPPGCGAAANGGSGSCGMPVCRVCTGAGDVAAPCGTRTRRRRRTWSTGGSSPSVVGHRHHPALHPGRLGVLRRRAGRVRPPGRGLVDRRPPPHGTGHRRLGHGPLATPPSGRALHLVPVRGGWTVGDCPTRRFANPHHPAVSHKRLWLLGTVLPIRARPPRLLRRL